MCIFTSLLISEMMSDGEGQLLTLLTVHKMITVKMVFLNVNVNVNETIL